MLNYGDDSSGFCTDIKICVTNDFTNYLYCMDLQLHFKTVKLCKIDQFDFKQIMLLKKCHCL